MHPQSASPQRCWSQHGLLSKATGTTRYVVGYQRRVLTPLTFPSPSDPVGLRTIKVSSTTGTDVQTPYKLASSMFALISSGMLASTVRKQSGVSAAEGQLHNLDSRMALLRASGI